MAEREMTPEVGEVNENWETVNLISEEEIEEYNQMWKKIIKVSSNGEKAVQAYDSFGSFGLKLRWLYKKYKLEQDINSPIKVNPDKSLLFHRLALSTPPDEGIENFDYSGEWSMRGFVKKYSHLLPPIEVSTKENPAEEN